MKTTQELIEIYQEALDEMDIADIDSDDFDDWSIVAADAERDLRGREVSVDVKWHNGRTTSVTGTVIRIVGDTVFLESSAGCVDGPVSTMGEA